MPEAISTVNAEPNAKPNGTAKATENARAKHTAKIEGKRNAIIVNRNDLPEMPEAIGIVNAEPNAKTNDTTKATENARAKNPARIEGNRNAVAVNLPRIQPNYIDPWHPDAMNYLRAPAFSVLVFIRYPTRDIPIKRYRQLTTVKGLPYWYSDRRPFVLNWQTAAAWDSPPPAIFITFHRKIPRSTEHITVEAKGYSNGRKKIYDEDYDLTEPMPWVDKEVLLRAISQGIDNPYNGYPRREALCLHFHNTPFVRKEDLYQAMAHALRSLGQDNEAYRECIGTLKPSGIGSMIARFRR
ncbi:peroxisomal assembly protein [Ascosphaera pollenicola]|nr:peroxisomal assembly protein [Ascosphaera pollenicola]